VAETVVNASIVAELRKETGAGMMDCKQALIEAGGDKEGALEILRKKGKAAAEKRADRSAKEGVVVTRAGADGRTASLVELRSETDFVARNEEFRKFAEDLADNVLEWSDAAGKSVEDFKNRKLKSGQTISDTLTNLIGKIGELGGVSGDKEEIRTLARDLAMQTAAFSPMVVRREEVPQDKLESEMRIEIDRAKAEGKPEPAQKKIAEGRVNKWLATVVLLEQAFVKEPKQTVNDVVAEIEKKLGHKIHVKSFTRFRIGE
jgi:elongation factor Ts